MKQSRIDELIEERLEEAKNKSLEFDSQLKFLQNFEVLTPDEQFNNYLEEIGEGNSSEEDKYANYTATALVLPYKSLIKFLKTQKCKQIDVWDDIDVVLAVADHFNVDAAVARYRLLSVVKLSTLQKDEKIDL